MDFNNTTDKSGIIQQIEFSLGFPDAGITSNATLFKQITSVVNNLYMDATGVIMGADGVWSWDDSNQTDRPTATTALVSGQSDYQIISKTPSINKDWLDVVEVNIADSSGDFYRLHPKSNKYFATPKTERDDTGGKPSTFYFNGASMFLDPEPNYSYTAGIEIVFNRAPLLFDTNDTTKRPGFSSQFHEYFVIGTKYWWLKNKVKDYSGADREKLLMKEMENEMGLHYGNRSQYQPNVLRRAKRDHK